MVDGHSTSEELLMVVYLEVHVLLVQMLVTRECEILVAAQVFMGFWEGALLIGRKN